MYRFGFLFFFQAEDGIRDKLVTGVQTCALPIFVFGHEFCCEVLDYGPGTARKLKTGTRVCSLPALLTAEGPQGIGYSNDNVGAYAERMLLSEALLLEVPNGLAAEHAALTEPLAVGIHAVAKANIRGDEVPLVIGCGPVGLAVIAALKLSRW